MSALYSAAVQQGKKNRDSDDNEEEDEEEEARRAKRRRAAEKKRQAAAQKAAQKAAKAAAAARARKLAAATAAAAAAAADSAAAASAAGDAQPGSRDGHDDDDDSITAAAAIRNKTNSKPLRPVLLNTRASGATDDAAAHASSPLSSSLSSSILSLSHSSPLTTLPVSIPQQSDLLAEVQTLKTMVTQLLSHSSRGGGGDLVGGRCPLPLLSSLPASSSSSLPSSSHFPQGCSSLQLVDPVHTSFQRVIESNNIAMWYMAMRAGPPQQQHPYSTVPPGTGYATW